MILAATPPNICNGESDFPTLFEPFSITDILRLRTHELMRYLSYRSIFRGTYSYILLHSVRNRNSSDDFVGVTYNIVQ